MEENGFWTNRSNKCKSFMAESIFSINKKEKTWKLENNPNKPYQK